MSKKFPKPNSVDVPKSQGKQNKKRTKSPKNKQAGKGSNPRSCFSKNFRDNFDEIQWTVKTKSL